jgi:heme A synthase
MAGLPLECVLMLGYALSLALIAFLLEWMAGHAHRRSRGASTAGFTYYLDRDVWQCRQDQHLFSVFSDSIRGTVTYRAPAATCNACPSKAACTDSSHGREIERNLTDVESGMKRFHRAVSLTLLALPSLILFVELVRTGGLYSRIVPASALTLSCVLIQ